MLLYGIANDALAARPRCGDYFGIEKEMLTTKGHISLCFFFDLPYKRRIVRRPVAIFTKNLNT
jgi:hypothetical protein